MRLSLSKSNWVNLSRHKNLEIVDRSPIRPAEPAHGQARAQTNPHSAFRRTVGEHYRRKVLTASAAHSVHMSSRASVLSDSVLAGMMLEPDARS